MDFNCSHRVDPPGAADINDDGQLSVLSGQLDRPVLVFSGGAIGDLGAPALPTTTAEVEPPISEPQAVARLLSTPVDETPPSEPPPAAAPTPRWSSTPRPRSIARGTGRARWR